MKSKVSVLFLLLSYLCAAQNGLHIVFSDNTSLIFKYSPVLSDSNFVNINNENYLKLTVREGNIIKSTDGLPVLPVFTFPVGVPSETGNTIQVINSSFVEVSGKIAPYPMLIKEKDLTSEKYEISANYNTFNSYETDLVTFGDFGLMRGLPVQGIVVKPIQFNAAQNKIRIYTITCKISFAPGKTNPVIEEDRLLEGTIVNYKTAASWKMTPNKLSKGIFNSVLSSGKWFRFEAPEEGIYKITKTMLTSYGIDPNTVDPKTIKIYNNGGKTLPENVNTPVPDDLVENAIYISGEGDGVFNDNDYILFYGRGVNFWEYDTTQARFLRRANPYSKENFFWITSGGVPGKRTPEKVNLPQGTANLETNTTPAFAYWDEDKINLPKSGRYFFGDEYNPNVRSHTYNNKLDNLIPNSLIKYVFHFINSDYYDRNLLVEDNTAIIYNSFIAGKRVDYESDFSAGHETFGSASYTGSLPDNRSILKFTFNAQGDKSFGYLDYFEISYNKNLIPTGDQLLFFSPDSSAVIQYNLSGFSNSNITVFDISDYSNVKIITNPFISGGEYRFISNEVRKKLSRYLAIGNNNFKSPVNPVEILNSNIHGEQTGASLIIFTPKEFREEAERLKVHHETASPMPMSAYVVQIDQIFNEFSGGMTDISGVRNFIKYAFQNWTIKPDHVLLFGDATYDYKNIEGQGGNYILTYETENSSHLLSSYPMDDYFVKISGRNYVDMPLGRINAASLSDAKAAVDKIIHYETSSETDEWLNTVSLVADDNIVSSGNEGNYHTPQSEDIASLLPGYFLKNKIYLGAYPTVITGFGRTKPGVTAAIINSVNKGTLILNYIGHGSPELWAHERVFEKSSTIPQFRNDKYFFLTAATCDFGYYDIPSVQSGAEVLVLKPDGGAIGAFTASRPVFSIENAIINMSFYTNLLRSQRDTMNFPVTIGEAYFKTKSTKNSENDNKFLLFGDPAVRLLVPRYYSFIDSINGKPITDNTIQLQALNNARVTGHIGKDSLPWEGYTGEGILTIYDSERRVPLPQLQTGYSVKVDGGIIFKGRVSINNGRFSSSFSVPKDISYENSNGKIIFVYSNSADDGIGYTSNFRVGGTDSTAVNDNKGPEIEVYFDDPANKNAYLVNPDSKLIIHLIDETGLNTTGIGVGHKLEGILNDNINDPIDFTNYFTGDLDVGGKSGTVNYKINTLQEGKYKLQVKAWDVFNNFSTETINFSVVSGNDLEITNVLNYPNPFSGSTTFTLQQNLSRMLDINIKIYTVAGRLIKNIHRPSIEDRFVKIEWDGKDEDGNSIANGTYFYKVILRSTDGQYNKSVLGKLAVIR